VADAERVLEVRGLVMDFGGLRAVDQLDLDVQHGEIVALIGRGGMGEVWRARDERLERDVAIKTLPPALSANADHLARFRREARAASALNHPNICTIYDLSEHDAQPFLVMELLSGTTLAAMLSQGALGLVVR